MWIKTSHVAIIALLPAVLAVCWAAGAETVTITSSRPVGEAISRLETAYGWAITYEDPPVTYAGDLRDVTSQVRNDRKSAGEPGVMQILARLPETFWFSFDSPSRIKPGTRAPEVLARGAIMDMLKSYSLSRGGEEVFKLTDSSGLFHIIATQCKDASGRMAKIVPLLDTPVTIPAARRNASEFLREVINELKARSGVFIGFSAAGLQLQQYSTEIASVPGETARSILSRLLAEMANPGPFTWALNYEAGYGYVLDVRVVRTAK
jgi:hypothetical protein